MRPGLHALAPAGRASSSIASRSPETDLRGGAVDRGHRRAAPRVARAAAQLLGARATTETMPPRPAIFAIARPRTADQRPRRRARARRRCGRRRSRPASDRRRLPGATPQRPPEPRQGDHHREEGRLDDVEALEPRRPRRSAQDLAPATTRRGARAPLARAHLPARRPGEASSSSSAIPRRWEPWPGKRNTGRARAGPRPPARPVRPPRRAPGRRARRAAPAALAADRHGAVLEARPGGGERVGDVERLEAGVLAQAGGQAPRPPRAARARFWPRAPAGGARRGLGPGAPLAARRSRRLLQDHVRVGAADAEGGDAGAARAPCPPPRRSGSLSSSTSPGVPLDLGGGGVDVQGLGQHAPGASPRPS